MEGGYVTDSVMNYSMKKMDYFTSARYDIIAQIDAGSRVLEIGCGAGATGHLALSQGRAREYIGVEIDENIGRIAREAISNVFIGDVEKIDLSFLGEFDVLIMSEVLEHLVDPWATLARLGRQVRAGGSLFCSSPNIATKQVISRLLRGHFEYECSGVFDITHLRWFTPESYRRLVEGSGFEIMSLEPLVVPRIHWRILNFISGDRLKHLSMTQISVVARRLAASEL
jgi:2-polyprenyl-3-methyl-5-hydroxy-6-metoxy-1,4-benzoquinol methylase